MIDKTFYALNLTVYYRDLLGSLTVSIAGVAWCLNASGLLFVVAFVLTVAAMHRAAFFIHELTHQKDNPRLRTFSWFWDLTVGAFFLVPAARFFGAHLTHHTAGIFRTDEDPQYFTLRGNWKLTFVLMVLVPPVVPLLQLLLAIATAFGGIAADGAFEGFLLRRGMPSGSRLRRGLKARVVWLSRYSLAAWSAYAVLLPETLGYALPLLYALQVAVWYLATWRIPLEHRMESRLERSDRQDQLLDSFTIEAFPGELLQPTGLKYHTAHHMYPGVPYHNLPALHAQLKETNLEYRRNVISLWDAIRGVPERSRAGENAG